MSEALVSVDRFWDLVESAFEAAGGDRAAGTAALAALLGELEPEEVVAFQGELVDRLDEAYTWDLWAAAHVLNGRASEEGFLHFRAWLVAQGREVFEAAVEDPNTLVELELDPGDAECALGELLTVAPETYEERTGSELEGRDPSTSLERDPAGEPWAETPEELSERLPALWAAYGWE